MPNRGMEKLKAFLDDNNQVYIYGTGLWGRNVFQTLKEQHINIAGFVVTQSNGNQQLFELPVYEFTDLNLSDAVLVLGLNQHNTKEVNEYLKRKHFDPDRIVYVKDVMGIDDVRCGYDEIPCIDITTRVGCSVNCKFCPQDIFLKQYYKDNVHRETFMSKETLMKCIEHMPEESAFQFGGFAEAFLHPGCIELLKLVCDTGRTVNLYTTLVGLDERSLYEVMELPIEYVTLHVADARGYAKIPLSDEYYRLLEIAVSSKRKDGKPFVDMCNAQAEPDERVAEICRGKYVIPSTLLDRAGNLKGDELVSNHIETGRIYCGVCGNGLNKNELLPDGTLLLCCMDYGMKHVLGNLKEQEYSEILEGTEMHDIKEGMKEVFDKDILCRKCSCANRI